MEIREEMEQYLEFCQYRKELSRNTVKAYRIDLEQFLRYVKEDTFLRSKIEAYITESLEGKKRDNYHCVLIAKNYDGVLELNQLVSDSYNRNDGHFYYMPRILYDDLEKTSDNIIISTACLGGILHKGNDDIRNRFICFLQRNRHRCFLEIQHHIDDGQKEYNKYYK